MISEADWKKVKKIKEKALEVFCDRALSDIGEAISKDSSTRHGKFLYVYKMAETHHKRLALIFDDLRRSNARVHLALIVSEGLVSTEDFSSLSEELRAFIQEHA
ncbi:hypothetical protein [Microbulbifer aggregans]|uniref:hypothetical protein n=1 Tax=Microbulbifer aggregans TaxID=1769779 RepID=UPI001CFD504A|nr:hypothetical protein [Microbulbifer aggregans]